MNPRTKKNKKGDQLLNWKVGTSVLLVWTLTLITLVCKKNCHRKQRSPSLKVDIAALHLDGQGSIRENEFTFFWHDKPVDERRENGVVFAVNNTLLQHVEV